MFEGLVSQLLAGYLGRYVKEFQKDQLKIGFWDQEVKLEDVKLILEAFDYLQLPVALKEGRVGKLSIKIPWKSLGRDPIIIVLEDVFISACQRDDYEWSLDSIERREFSGKKAKLAAAELAKLSRRVCDNQSGRSFISYISAKILDGIQVSVRNVHVTYMDNQNDPAQFLFGLRFSSLTIMTDSRLKQKSVGTSNGKVGIGQVNKIVEILGLAIYCNTSEEGSNLLGSVDSSNCNRDEYILEPFDATVSLVVNKSGKLESDVPQYTMSAELIGLVILFNEAQLKQILILMDYLGTCALRRKYGRYRPWQNPLSHKVDGWQRMWWHYAQESILSDVHKKLRKISWSHFGRRISYRRKYVKLYRKKLVFLFQEQPVSEDILQDLEQMEKESEIDDILNCRSIAENQLKEFLSSINSSSTINNLDTAPEKQQNDDRSSNKQRGWLNWLSLGMLGAGGTTDSSQFAGVISDETIKAIYEATKFHPLPSFDGVSNTVKDSLYLSSIKLNIQQIIAGLRSKKYDNEIIRVISDGVTIENKLWEDSVTILSSINSVEMIEPSKQHVILVTKKDFLESSSSKHAQPFVSIQVQTLPFNRDREMSIKVLVQPFEVTYDPNILLHLMDFRRVWCSFQFQHQRVLSSLNGFDNLNVRLLLKSEYIFLNRTKMTLDLRFSNVTVNFPWRNKESESFNMVLDVGGLLFRSIPKNELLGSANKDQSCHLVANILHSTTMEEMKLGLQLQDLYNFFQIDLTDLELSIMMPNFPQAISVFNRFNGSLIFGSCMFLDESTLKQLEVHCSLSSLTVHFSPSIYDALVRLMTCFDISFEDSNMERTNASDILHYSLTFDVDHVICNVNLEDCVEKSLFITLSLEKLNLQYAHHELLEFWICMKTLDINSSTLEGDSTGHVLCSHRNSSVTSSKDAHIGILSEACSENSVSAEGCFLLHYQAARRDLDVHHNYTIFLNNMELHIYPRIIGLLVGFFNKISKLGGSSSVSSVDNSLKLSLEIEDPKMMYGINLMKYGISNYCEAGSTTLASIPFHNFPFATIRNLGCFADLDKSVVLGLSEWRRTACVRSRNSVRSQKWSVRKKSRMFNLSTDKYTTSGGSDGCDVFSIDLNLNEIRGHFHDSSCIVGTLTLPLANSVIFSQRQDCWDILGSIDGLLLSSSWSSPNIREILWGSSLQEVSSILNFRVRKGKDEALDPKLEICIAVQHVCCILSPEYLAILIGYFSLSDWTSNKTEEVVAENPKYGRITPTYKFEILDSSVIFPLEGNSLYSLQLGIEQLVGSFVEKGSSTDVFKGIPKECLIPPSQIAGKVNCIDVFGSSISLSLLLLEANGHLRLQLDPDTNIAKVPFISQLDADLWVRIPYNTSDSVGPSIMMHAEFCQITAEEDYMLSGLNAFQYIVDGFATVGRDSKCFASDILQFKQLKKSLNEVTVGSNGNPSDTLIETKFFVNSFSIELNQSGRGITHPSKLVAQLEMRLALSVTFRNDTPICLDVGISGLVLYSSCSSVILVSSPSYDSNSSCLEIHFSKSDSGKDEVALSVPSVDIWIYLSDWNELILLLGSYKVEREPSAITTSKGANWDLEVPENFGSEKAPTSPLSEILIEPSDLIVKSENISLSFHFPVWVKEGAFDNSGEVKSCFKREKKTGFDGKDCKSIAFTLYSRGTECVISKGSVKLKSNVEKIRGMLEVIENRTVSSLPFFQIFPVNVVSEVCERQGTVHVSTEVRVETLNVWLSYQVLYFWHDVGFKTSKETESSQVPVHTNAFKLHLGKASLLLSDGRWSCNGPLVETLVRNLLVDATLVEHSLEATVAGDLLVNYNNIHKVMWEPFIEPWNVQLKMERKREQTALMNTSFVTDIHMRSTAQLNLNFTEPLIETIFRVNEMIKGSSSQTGVRDFNRSTKNLGSQATDSAYARRYAPYILQNDTSMPFVFWVSRGSMSVNNIDNLAMKKGNIVHPGSYVPIYIDESPEEPILHQKPAHSLERLNEKKNGVSHHMISIQLDGTSEPSLPLSMDLVGLSYFEVNFSKTSDTIEVVKDGNIPSCNRKIEEAREDHKSGFVFPVVFEVSVQRHGKLIRLYSTVILLNETSMPLELRFDIPFGVSSKVLDPIYPGKEFPLPVHLAESGRMSWRPLGANYLWSEANPLSNILSQESRLGFLRSFVCYPSHPSSDPFRCCISIQDICLPSSNSIRNLSSCHIQECITPPYNLDKSKKRFIRQVRFTTPLLVKNCFPQALSFTIESGGVTRSIVISEVDTASVFHIDSTHDLGILMHMHGFKSTILKFPRAEVFMTMAKLNESKFSQSETLTFYPDERNGPLCVTVEKVMDAFCGARELCISVPFLLYNCSSLPLTICDCDNEKKGNGFFIPSCYHLMGQEKQLSGKPGLAVLSSEEESFASPSNFSNSNNFSFEDHTISLRETSILNKGNAIGPMDFSRKKFVRESELIENEDGRRAKAYMYSPQVTLTASELMVRLTTYLPERGSKVIQSSFWSNPFFLVSPSGSICVTIPQRCSKGAFLVSATSSPIDGPLAGRTRAITFQPRYVISNACSKELCFKQKGTDFIYRLVVGQHSHLHWADTTRELLVSIRFNEPGWQWSGSFLPDHLGDAQVKMRKYAGALNMVRVEVQNANVSIGDEKIVGSSNGQSGTHLILLSDDNTGFMPYRIDNFSMERLRIYQQKCETFETTVHSYTSCPYAWDEPCYPHRLVVEVPGERVIGSYSLDDVRECIPVHLPQTSEKPERRLVLSVHAEGAIKVLSVVDSNYHILKDVKEAGFSGFKEKMKHDFKEAHEFIERVTIHLSFIGISLINSSPQEIVYTCAKDVKVEALQSVDRQKIYFHIFSLQIDNQLRNSLYPVILSFDQEQRGSSPHLNYREDRLNPKQETGSPNVYENACESILSFAASKWRTSDSSLVSFEYINLRLAPLRIELEEQMLLSLFGFVRTATLSFRSRIPGHSYSDLQTLDNIVNFQAKSSMENKGLDQLKSLKVSNLLEKHGSNDLLPSVVPIGAPWQQIFLLARRQKKIYIEVLDLAPIKLTLSFSSAPWMIRDAAHSEAVSLILVSNTVVQRGLMALVDVEGAPVYLRQLTIAHHLASWDSIKEILIRHYTRQLIHEMYKVFGSAGVIGNPMGFARNVGLGIKDFLSVPARGVLQSPSGLITGVALGTKSLVRNTVYAVSNAATQFSKAAHKGIVAFTFDEQAVAKQEKSLDSHSKGLLNEFLEGLTGFLQSPVKGVEKHGLPGVLSGIALGTAGLVARPVASILEVTGKTAQSIRNRSSPHQSNRFRIRFTRPLARELPLAPYSWEEAIGTSMLLEAEDSKFKDEIFVMCKALKRAGKFIVITERLVLIFSCSSLVGFGSPEFCGIMDPEWVIEVEMGLESVVHIDREEDVVNIVGSSLETLLKQQQIKRGSPRGRRWGPPNSVPLFQTSVELSSREEAEDVLQLIWHTVEQGKGQRWGAHVLHRSNLR